MRKLILKMFLSLHGFVARLNRDNTFIFHSMDEKVTEWTIDLLWKAGVHIMSSKTYKDMAVYWPGSSESYAPPMNQIPKVVFPRTLKHTDLTDSKIASGDLKQEIEELKKGKKSYISSGRYTFYSILVSQRTCRSVLSVNSSGHYRELLVSF